jgi:hypothetical protein
VNASPVDPASIAQGRIPMGAILRDPRPKSTHPAVHGDYANIYATTDYPGGKLLPFESGINRMAPIRATDGSRVPAILIASSPHKVGRIETPWQDTFEPDRGYVRYFGDNKTPGVDPATARGNRILLEQLEIHAAGDEEIRRTAVPLVFFRRIAVDGKQKGFPQFNGFGIIRRAELVVQLDSTGASFSNYVFEFIVFTIVPEHEVFDWKWINERRNPALTTAQTMSVAPLAWRRWVKQGAAALPKVRRDVQRLRVRKRADQLPLEASGAARLLRDLHKHYEGTGALFEPIAAWVVERRLGAGGIYRHHGVTRASGDRGFDFVGTLELGSGFGSVQLVVLGQAKCENPESPTNAVHVARTVARLRRGWIGAYVTTSYFSASTQEEILEDKYPILLIDGRTVAEELSAFLNERKVGMLQALKEIQSTYGELTEVTDPDQLTFSGWPIDSEGALK